MLADQPDQRHQPDLGVDVHARPAQEQRNQCAADRQRHGDQDHQRVAEAFELGRQHQENDRQCQGKGDPQGTAFLNVLPRCAGVVEGKTGGCLFPGDLAHEVDGFPHAHQRHAGQDGRVELLELVQLSRSGTVGDGDQGRQRQQFTLGVFHVVIVQPVRIVTERPLDLGNDLVAATFNGESVDLAFTQQGRQGPPQVLHGNPHLRSLGAVDIHHHFRLVEGQVNVDKRKLAGFLRTFFYPVDHLQQQFVIVGGVDDELERHAFAGARQ
ncbi:hypothetical protein D3C81_1246290 [compost metagenome]